MTEKKLNVEGLRNWIGPIDKEKIAPYLKPILRIITSIGITLLVILLERNIQRMYLKSDINETFYAHFYLYLIVSILVTLILWRLESKKGSTPNNIIKGLFAIIIFGSCIIFSNRIELCLNSKTNKRVKEQNYIVQLNGLLWGEIGIRDIKSGAIDRINIREDELKGIVENDTIRIEFKEGLFGIKYSPIIKK